MLVGTSVACLVVCVCVCNIGAIVLLLNNVLRPAGPEERVELEQVRTNYWSKQTSFRPKMDDITVVISSNMI
jgi:hypothetical protein